MKYIPYKGKIVMYKKRVGVKGEFCKRERDMGDRGIKEFLVKIFI